VKGEGIAWFREFLGEDPTRPIVHPALASAFGFRIMGLLPAAGPRRGHHHSVGGLPARLQLLHDVGVLRRQGQVRRLLRSGGRELFDIMCEAGSSAARGLLHDGRELPADRKRAMELLDCMKAHGKAWELYVFSSANAIAKYTMRELVELGVSWIWLGLESPRAGYAKLKGTDTRELVASCSSTASACSAPPSSASSTTRRRTSAEIEHAVAHDADFHQFMLYTPCPARRSTGDGGRGPPAAASTSPTSTASTSSTSGTPPSRRDDSKRSSTGRSASTTSATVRASIA
jgi:hypothetical protein